MTIKSPQEFLIFVRTESSQIIFNYKKGWKTLLRSEILWSRYKWWEDGNTVITVHEIKTRIKYEVSYNDNTKFGSYN